MTGRSGRARRAAGTTTALTAVLAAGAVTLSTVTAAFASVCDGELTARAAAAAIAGLLDLDGDEVRGEVVAFVRDAAKDGLLR